MSEISRLPRPIKEVVAKGIHGRLVERQKNGPAEGGLDIYIDQVNDVSMALSAHITGHADADAARVAQLDKPGGQSR